MCLAVHSDGRNRITLTGSGGSAEAHLMLTPPPFLLQRRRPLQRPKKPWWLHRLRSPSGAGCPSHWPRPRCRPPCFQQRAHMVSLNSKPADATLHLTRQKIQSTRPTNGAGQDKSDGKSLLQKIRKPLLRVMLPSCPRAANSV